jgi:hypothetical protein
MDGRHGTRIRTFMIFYLTPRAARFNTALLARRSMVN